MKFEEIERGRPRPRFSCERIGIEFRNGMVVEGSKFSFLGFFLRMGDGTSGLRAGTPALHIIFERNLSINRWRYYNSIPSVERRGLLEPDWFLYNFWLYRNASHHGYSGRNSRVAKIVLFDSASDSRILQNRISMRGQLHPGSSLSSDQIGHARD